METLAKTRALGGSLIATIPRAIVEHEGLMPGDTIKIDVRKIRKSWFGALKGIGPFTKEDKLDIDD